MTIFSDVSHAKLIIFGCDYLLSACVSQYFIIRCCLIIIRNYHVLFFQWFGNLVTMKWWDDLWLNEAFANYMAYVGVDHFDKSWKVVSQ